LRPAISEQQAALPPTIKKSLLRSIQANKEQGHALLSESKSLPKTSLLAQLSRKKKADE